MFFRKLYIRLALFFKTINAYINSIALTFIMLILIGLFVNYVIMEKFVLTQAESAFNDKNYPKASKYYSFAQTYYHFFRLTNRSKELYFYIPYKKSMCLYNLSKKDDAHGLIMKTITSIQNEYGFFSHETALFIRKYMIEYFLNDNNIKISTQEFHNLMTIFKKIDVSIEEKADTYRLCGDIYYKQNDFDTATSYYMEAYDAFSRLEINRYTSQILTHLTERIVSYAISNKDYKTAEKYYNNTIAKLKTNSGNANKDLANLYIQQAEFFIKYIDRSLAVKSYLSANEIIAELPYYETLKKDEKHYQNKLIENYQKLHQYTQANEYAKKVQKKRFIIF